MLLKIWLGRDTSKGQRIPEGDTLGPVKISYEKNGVLTPVKLPISDVSSPREQKIEIYNGKDKNNKYEVERLIKISILKPVTSNGQQKTEIAKQPCDKSTKKDPGMFSFFLSSSFF